MNELAPARGWRGPAQVRIAAPPPAERGWLFRMLSRLSRRLGREDVPDVISVLHLNPRLFWAWLFFASRLMPYGRLSPRLRELLILRTGWNCRSRYEWGQHVEIALRSGVLDQEIVGITQGPHAFAGSGDQAALQACDELCAEHCLSDDTWQQLSRQYDHKQLIEIMLLVGHYIMIAAFLNSAGLRLEPSIEQKLRDFNHRVAHRATEGKMTLA